MYVSKIIYTQDSFDTADPRGLQDRGYMWTS